MNLAYDVEITSFTWLQTHHLRARVNTNMADGRDMYFPPEHNSIDPCMQLTFTNSLRF